MADCNKNENCSIKRRDVWTIYSNVSACILHVQHIRVCISFDVKASAIRFDTIVPSDL